MTKGGDILQAKLFYKGVPVHNINTYGGVWGKVQPILNFNAKWRWANVIF